MGIWDVHVVMGLSLHKCQIEGNITVRFILFFTSCMNLGSRVLFLLLVIPLVDLVCTKMFQLCIRN